MTISKNIFAIRNEKRLTQNEVALRMGIDQPNYARLEKRDDELSIKQLTAIAEALGVTVDDILHYGEEKPQIVDNEKVKELENKVLLLEKDLEIWRNRYELKMNEIKNYIDSLFTYYGIIDDLVYKYVHQYLIFFLKENLKDTVKIKEYLNSISLNDVLDFMVTETENESTDQVFKGALELLGYNNHDLFKYKIKNIYVGISLNKSFSQEKLNKLLEENGLSESFYHDSKNYDAIKSFRNSLIYQEKIKPFELLHFEIKGLNQYKPNQEYPPQNGFFRIDNIFIIFIQYSF